MPAVPTPSARRARSSRSAWCWSTSARARWRRGWRRASRRWTDRCRRALGFAAAFVAATGHVWPVWHGFRGGKGVGALLGGMAVLWPMVLLPLFAVWVGVLVATGYVGLASIIATACLVPLAWWMPVDRAAQVFAIAAALLVLFTHRVNVRRLRDGTESRFERVRIWRRRA